MVTVNSLIDKIIFRVWDASHIKNKRIKLNHRKGLHVQVELVDSNKTGITRQFHSSAVLNVRGNPGLAAQMITYMEKAKFKNPKDF